MARQRWRSDFWTTLLPPQLECGLIAGAVVVWMAATAFFHFYVIGQFYRILEIFSQIGTSSSNAPLTALTEPLLWFGPIAAIPVAFSAWKAARNWLLRSFFSSI